MTTPDTFGHDRGRVLGADGLRAIACFLVVWHHLSQRLNPDQSPFILQKIHFAGMRGEVGVSLFFVLSGCLLSLPFWNAYLRAQPMPSLRRYWLNRGARVIPAFWLNLILCTILASVIFDLNTNWARLVSGLFFVNSYHYSTFFPAELNGPLWSIGLEVSCYVLLPIILLSILKLVRGFYPAFFSLFSWILVLQILNPWIISTFMTSDDLKGWEFGLTGGAKQWLPYWNIASFFTQFLFGSLSALIIANIKYKLKTPRLLFDFLSASTLLLATLLVWQRLEPGQIDSWSKQPYLSPFYAALVALSLVFLNLTSYLGRMLDNQLFRWLARISFSVYLWHMVIITIIERKIDSEFSYYGLHDPKKWFVVSTIVVLITLLISTFSWRFFEEPILRKARNLSLGGNERN